MGLTLSLAVYFVIWWLVLFTVLPLGVSTQGEEGDVVPGTPESAPATPQLKWKFLLTTIIAAIVFGIFYAMVASQIIDIRTIPAFPPQAQ